MEGILGEDVKKSSYLYGGSVKKKEETG